jgi:hypothetical protein
MFVAVPLLLAGAGCGKSIYPLQGRVTLDGKPVPNAMVRLVPENQTSPRLAYGQTDADGRFVLSTFGGNDGILPGTYRVTVSNPDNTMPPLGAPSGNEEENAKAMQEYRRRYEEMKKRAPIKGQLPVMYAEPDMTPLRWKVPEDGAEANLELSSTPSPPAKP